MLSFDNGLSAYNRLREEPFELLLTDIVMPEMDGIELARRATELDPDIKVMFITGFAAVALNPDSQGPEGRQGAVEALPPARPRQRGREAAGRLKKPGPPRLAPRRACAMRPAQTRARVRRSRFRGPGDGRVAQRESTSLTSMGSQVQSLSRPPSPPSLDHQAFLRSPGLPSITRPSFDHQAFLRSPGGFPVSVVPAPDFWFRWPLHSFVRR